MSSQTSSSCSQPSLNASDRKSTRLNSSHGYISYAVFCLKKKKIMTNHDPAYLHSITEPRKLEARHDPTNTNLIKQSQQHPVTHFLRTQPALPALPGLPST